MSFIKKNVIILLICISFCSLYSQVVEIPDFDISELLSSSYQTPTGNIHLRLLFSEEYQDFIDSLRVVSVSENYIYEQYFSMINSYEMKAILPNPDISIQSIGLKYVNDSFSLISPYQVPVGLATDPFYYLSAGDDVVGEAELQGDEVLDLIGQSFVLEQDPIDISNLSKSLRVSLENLSATYPASSSYITYYMYGVCLINPDHLEGIDVTDIDFANLDLSLLGDLNVYVMLKAEIPYFLSSGLYKIPISYFAEPDSIDFSQFESISAIDTSVNQGELLLGLDFESLLLDDEFGEWPNSSKSLLALPFIIKIANILNPSMNYDFGVPTLVYCEPFRIINEENTIPEISYNYISSRMIEISYSDQNGHYPVIAEYQSENQFIEAYSLSTDFSENAIFIISSSEDLTQQANLIFSDDSLNYVTLDVLPNSTSDEVIGMQNDISVYPNPYIRNSKELSIDFKRNIQSTTTVELYNIKGQKVYEQDYSYEKDINISSKKLKQLTSGVYFVRVVEDNIHRYKKILILK
ncbi:MAG: T9SS type A sorting domain-containing protein [Candidatus Cloacimonetes bacterium]|nr:T9SS type A sorting domain-containing protein [Candidatus Cloacimonadota bacterium]MDD4155740.1 T9SS type A sorting domain-containing protein [Candidatus Cloacimonadota bacterium]